MHVEIRCQFFGTGGGTEGQASWPFHMEKSALDLLINNGWGFQGPVSSKGDPSLKRYVLRRGGSLLLSIALEQPARYEHEVLQRVVRLLKTDKRNNLDWELFTSVEDDTHIDGLMRFDDDSLEESFAALDAAQGPEEDLVNGDPSTYDFTPNEDEIEDLLSVLEEYELVLDERAVDVVIEVDYDV